jgi:hypothetical protein
MTMETALVFFFCRKKINATQEYVSACSARDNRPNDTPVYLVYGNTAGGSEPILFTCHFQTWYPAIEASDSANILVSDALKDYDKQYTLEELVANPPKFLDKTKLEVTNEILVNADCFLEIFDG